MASLAQQFTGLRFAAPLAKTVSRPTNHCNKSKLSIVSAAPTPISNAQTKERLKLKELFEDACERCRTAPTEGVSFILENFHAALDKYDFVSELGMKIMILVSLSTKKLKPTPGDMIRNPKLVFEKAEEMAQTFSQRIAQAEAKAQADMLRFQPESGLTLSSDGILGPLILV